MSTIVRVGLVLAFIMGLASPARSTTKGLSQIVTPDLQSEGDVSLSLQIPG